MLVFPQWSRSQVSGEHCHTTQWHPSERFAPYIARPYEYIRHPQYEEDVSTGGSSPEHSDAKAESGTSEDVICEWQGCRTRCSGITRLSAHLTRNHGNPHTDGLFYCRWKNCSRPQRGFNARYKMLVHVRTHTNERPHACPQCDKSFSRAENLKIHLRSHSGEKPYVCPYEGCGKAYSNSSDRFKHTRTHTIDKPYSCKVPNCNKRYTDPSSLRKHVKTYKHYRPKEAPTPESSDDSLEKSAFSPVDPTYKMNTSPPVNSTYSTSGVIVRPMTSTNYLPENVKSNDILFNRVYMPEQMYSLRVPPYSYYQCLNVDYTRKYEQNYSHYNSNVSYPVRPETTRDTAYDPPSTEMETEEMPLNLKYDRSIEDMVKRDMPLDLSTKS